MSPYETTYRLVRIDTIPDTDRRVADAIRIYSANTPTTEKTLSNEILYWKSRYKDQFVDQFFLFAFEANGQVIGFGEAVYFETNKLIVLDYMTIEIRHNRNSAFHSFLESIIYFFEDNCADFDFIATEIPYTSNEEEPNNDGKLWIKLLQLQGFKTIHSLYFQPQLGLDRYETEVQGRLMIFARDDISQISKPTYLGIVHTIYFDHYSRWCEPFLGSKAVQYRKYIEGIFRKVELAAPDSKFIRINGVQAKLPSASRQMPAEAPRIDRFFVLSIACLFMSIITLALLQYYFEMTLAATISISLISLFLYVAVMSIASKEAREVLGHLKDVTKNVFGIAK